MDRMVERHGSMPNYIFVVGGLGSNRYLLKCIKEHFNGRLTRIERPANSAAAVMIGESEIMNR
jgi:sugar (pentulose or hexulose) kinase